MQLSDAKGSFLFASSDALLNDPFASNPKMAQLGVAIKPEPRVRR